MSKTSAPEIGGVSPRKSLRRRMAALAAMAVVLMLPSGASAETLLPLDQDWSNEGGWHVYYNAANGNSCFAESRGAAGAMLLGISGEDGRLFFGLAGERTSELDVDTSHEITLNFDGRSSWTAGMTSIKFEGTMLLLGGFADAAELRREIAAGSVVVVKKGARRLASLPLKGTSAALKAVDECVAALKANEPAADTKTAPITAAADAPTGALPGKDQKADSYVTSRGWFYAGQATEDEHLFRKFAREPSGNLRNVIVLICSPKDPNWPFSIELIPLSDQVDTLAEIGPIEFEETEVRFTARDAVHIEKGVVDIVAAFVDFRDFASMEAVLALMEGDRYTISYLEGAIILDLAAADDAQQQSFEEIVASNGVGAISTTKLRDVCLAAMTSR